MHFSNRFLLTVACVWIGSVGPTQCVAGLPVYGSPGFTTGVGGYIAFSPGGYDGINRNIAVNNAGIAIASANRFNAAGGSTDSRALRWSATTSEVLGDLGTSGGTAFTRAFAINEAGVAVGGASIGFGEERTVRWSNPSTTAAALTTPAGFAGALGYDINESGTTLGIGFLPLGMGIQAVRWNATGTPTLLPKLPGFFSTEVRDLNDAGIALGRAFRGSDDERAVRWDAAGTIVELGHLGLNAAGTTFVAARALNTTGTAVGFAATFDPSGSYLGTAPVRWQAGTTAATELARLSIAPNSFGLAGAINDAGTAVGSVSKSPAFPTDEFGTRAARWDAGGTAVTVLGTLGVSANGEAHAEALAINATGLIVGTTSAHNSATELPDPRAVLWNPTETTAIDLNTLVDPSVGWTLTHAFAISDTGWVAGLGDFDPDGSGGQEAYARLFLLHVPEPANFLLLSFAMTCASAMNWRRRGTDLPSRVCNFQTQLAVFRSRP
jgi:uncharacterized membrane protein